MIVRRRTYRYVPLYHGYGQEDEGVAQVITPSSGDNGKVLGLAVVSTALAFIATMTLFVRAVAVK